VIIILLMVAPLVFLPGVSGPWVFDDLTNIVVNDYLKITSLNTENLKRAAYSLQSGPLQRPIPMLSFALNYYFTGTFDDTTAYKLTNIFIHSFNTLLVFWLASLIFLRYREVKPASQKLNAVPAIWLALLLALMWATNPMGLTSILYVVQRMTSLSATFVLMGIIGYILGRLRILQGRRFGLSVAGLSVLVFGTLGMLSKENAALLPIFILAIEITLFTDEWPWKRLAGLSAKWRRIIWIAATITGLLFVVYAVYINIGPFNARPFSLYERVLTESRVLFFYIFQILLPRLHRFGLQHDDIEISRSLVDPWTTLPSVIGIIILLALALATRKREPLISLGILWFFVGHAIESTIISLEIAHEHRNYLAMLGPLLVVVGLIDSLISRSGKRSLLAIPIVLLITYGGVSLLRASQWSSPDSFYRSEAAHHPDSPRSQAGLGTLLSRQGDYVGSIAAFRHAARLEPGEAGYLINIHILASWMGESVSDKEKILLLGLLRSGHITPLTKITLEYTAGCTSSSCRSLRKPLESWIRVLIKRLERHRKSVSFYQYLLGRTLDAQGRTNEAIAAFIQSHNNDTDYLHPLFSIVAIYIRNNDPINSRKWLERLRVASARSAYPRSSEIEQLNVVISEMELNKEPNK